MSTTTTVRRDLLGPETQARRRSFDELRRAGQRATRSGRLQEALRCFEGALALAREEGDQQLIDLATCLRSGVAIALGEHREVRSPLRDILMRSASSEVGFLAADNLSRSYEITKDFKKGLFYAKVARNHARASDNSAWLAATFNQSGNCLLGDSFFQEAAEAYQQALALLPVRLSLPRAILMLNLGYCQSVLGNLRRGFELGFKSLRWFRRLGARSYQPWSHLDLCYAYLQIDRADRALRHGRRALEMAERSGEQDLIKNALFMLGEAEHAAGEVAEAYGCFKLLQRSFYPDAPQLAELMLAVDMRQMVNLRA
ncbi:MAG: hypothetical protein D6696_06020 [Acidobacteria bacterium]|nr:MAG: hypothetical protein D6696_06020 [Acidobacteriota bacterium]